MSKNILFLTILACLSAHSWPAVDGQHVARKYTNKNAFMNGETPEWWQVKFIKKHGYRTLNLGTGSAGETGLV